MEAVFPKPVCTFQHKWCLCLNVLALSQPYTITDDSFCYNLDVLLLFSVEDTMWMTRFHSLCLTKTVNSHSSPGNVWFQQCSSCSFVGNTLTSSHWHTDQISYSPGLLLLWSGYSMQIVCLCWCRAALPSGCAATDAPPTMSLETLQPRCVYHWENDSSQSATSACFFLQPTGWKTQSTHYHQTTTECTVRK